MEKTSSFQSHLKKVRTRYQGKKITHEQACRVLSCDYGIGELSQMCNCFLLDYEALSKVYRAVEKVLYKLGLNPGPRIKCGLAFRLKYALDKSITALLANTTASSLDKYLKKIEPYLKVGIILEYNPDFTQNPRLYFFLLYLKTRYKGRYEGSLAELFLTLLRLRPVELTYDRFVQNVVTLTENEKIDTKNGKLAFFKRERALFEKLLTSFYERTRVGIFVVSSEKVYIADSEYIAFQRGDLSSVKVKKGKWVAEVETFNQRVEVLQVTHDSVYKKNKEFCWEKESWKKPKVRSRTGRVGIFCSSVYPFEEKAIEDLFRIIFFRLDKWSIYDNRGVTSRFKGNLSSMKVVEKDGKAVAIRLVSLYKK